MYSEKIKALKATPTNAYCKTAVKQALNKTTLCSKDLPLLLSESAAQLLPAMAARSARETRQRFGANLQLFLPLYLSNLCTNVCSYCGFSAQEKVKRTWLRPEQIAAEISAIKLKNIEHLLLVTGEAEHKIGEQYFCTVLKQLRPHFAHLQLEAQPLSQASYANLQACGLDGVVVYQETYHRDVYHAVHLKGQKMDFNWRLNTPDRIARAGVEKIGLGILLGLADWRTDALALAAHLDYLQKNYWQHKFSLGFPRLRPCASDFDIPHPVDDKTLIQLILAFRLCFSDVDINLSTREPAALRNALLGAGITHISAESSTQPGGYSAATSEQLQQFDIDDKRSITDVSREMVRQNFQPVFADQIPLVEV